MCYTDRVLFQYSVSQAFIHQNVCLFWPSERKPTQLVNLHRFYLSQWFFSPLWQITSSVCRTVCYFHPVRFSLYHEGAESVRVYDESLPVTHGSSHWKETNMTVEFIDCPQSLLSTSTPSKISYNFRKERSCILLVSLCGYLADILCLSHHRQGVDSLGDASTSASRTWKLFVSAQNLIIIDGGK